MRMQLNNLYIENRIFIRRVIIASIMIILLLLVLLIRTFNLQIIQHGYYDQESLNNQLVLLATAPTRGKIFDRNGMIIADNQLTYRLTLTPEKTNNIQQTLAQLNKHNIITKYNIEKFYERRKYYKKFQDIPLVHHLSEEKMTHILGNQSYTGLNITPNFKRIYPTKEVFSHVLGYVGHLNKAEKKKYPHKDYTTINQIGKNGIEKQYESLLRGFVGRKKTIRNASGRTLSEQNIKYAIPGDDLYLTLDYQLQKKAINLLGDDKGAIVMMMVKTGEILVLASAPSFDANLFIGGISSKDYKILQNNPKKPLFNRAIHGTYPPGSTIKPFIALAGLENGIIPDDYQVFCKGWYTLPNHNHRYRDWKKSGHGEVDMTQSIAQSCDVFFYDIANTIGIDKIYQYLQKFNFGTQTNIDMVGEVSGILPSKEWKKYNRGESWYRGETIIVGIGQGFMTTTPLQLAVSTTALANYGKLVKPKLLNYTQSNNGKITQNPSIIEDLVIDNIKNYEQVIQGMRQTIYGIHGTARRLNHNLNYTIAGKTGTAQVFSLARNESYVAQNIEKHLRDHALFTAFAPIEKPKVAIAVIIENAGSGAVYAAPIAKKMLDAYFKVKPIPSKTAVH